jgi:signal transduction histidine kinase
VETDTLEGIPVMAVFSRSAMSNWSVAIGVPSRELARHWWIPIAWIIAGAVVLLGSGIVLAHRIGSRISGSIRGLIAPATALGRGDPVVLPRLRLQEADEVGRELLIAAERLQDREKTLAIVAHDLRSPLAALMVGASATERRAAQLPGAEPIRALAASLVETSDRMSGMVDDLLAISVSTGGGRSLLNIAPISAASLLERATGAARMLFESAGVELQIESAGALPELQVDSDRMLRVFTNLLDNALKFTAPSGRVVLRAEAQPGAVQFCVANTGPALSAEERERMFQPFWQAGRGERRGAGLGLSICRSIVQAHGGTIRAAPEAGMRVRICIALPRAEPGVAAAAPARNAPAQ